MVSIILTGIIGRPWILVIIGVIVYSIGEIVWYNIQGFYVAGGYIDLLWIVGFMLIGVGAYVNYYTIKHPY
jgi:steroid 5-alpha reductase family enzyme